MQLDEACDYMMESISHYIATCDPQSLHSVESHLNVVYHEIVEKLKSNKKSQVEDQQMMDFYSYCETISNQVEILYNKRLEYEIVRNVNRCQALIIESMEHFIPSSSSSSSSIRKNEIINKIIRSHLNKITDEQWNDLENIFGPGGWNYDNNIKKDHDNLLDLDKFLPIWQAQIKSRIEKQIKTKVMYTSSPSLSSSKRQKVQEEQESVADDDNDDSSMAISDTEDTSTSTVAQSKKRRRTLKKVEVLSERQAEADRARDFISNSKKNKKKNMSKKANTNKTVTDKISDETIGVSDKKRRKSLERSAAITKRNQEIANATKK